MSNAAVSRIVLAPYCEETVAATAREALEELGGQATIGFVFASIDYEPYLADFQELLTLHAHLPLLVGCSGSGVIGMGQEAEQKTGFSLLLLHLPETEISLHPVSPEMVEETETPEEWHAALGVRPEEVDAWIALVDPFGFPVEGWLQRWNKAYPAIPVIGGLSSSRKEGEEGESVFVFGNREVLPTAHVLLVRMRGGVRIVPMVAQGCRPIGEPLTITAAEGNVLLRLGGKAAYSALAEAFESLDEEEKAMAQGNLFAGLACSEYLEEFRRGDFLVRPILGGDSDSGAIAVGAYPRVGQSLQWQLRDQQSADADLKERLAMAKLKTGKAIASLVFSCAGRGKELFEVENHDAQALSRRFGSLPVAGFFCNGEIGPVHGNSFVHGYSASMAFFSE